MNKQDSGVILEFQRAYEDRLFGLAGDIAKANPDLLNGDPRSVFTLDDLYTWTRQKYGG